MQFKSTLLLVVVVDGGICVGFGSNLGHAIWVLRLLLLFCCWKRITLIFTRHNHTLIHAWSKHNKHKSSVDIFSWWKSQLQPPNSDEKQRDQIVWMELGVVGRCVWCDNRVSSSATRWNTPKCLYIFQFDYANIIWLVMCDEFRLKYHNRIGVFVISKQRRHFLVVVFIWAMQIRDFGDILFPGIYGWMNNALTLDDFQWLAANCNADKQIDILGVWMFFWCGFSLNSHESRRWTTDFWDFLDIIRLWGTLEDFFCEIRETLTDFAELRDFLRLFETFSEPETLPESQKNRKILKKYLKTWRHVSNRRVSRSSPEKSSGSSPKSDKVRKIPKSTLHPSVSMNPLNVATILHCTSTRYQLPTRNTVMDWLCVQLGGKCRQLLMIRSNNEHSTGDRWHWQQQTETTGDAWTLRQVTSQNDFYAFKHRW